MCRRSSAQRPIGAGSGESKQEEAVGGRGVGIGEWDGWDGGRGWD